MELHNVRVTIEAWAMERMVAYWQRAVIPTTLAGEKGKGAEVELRVLMEARRKVRDVFPGRRVEVGAYGVCGPQGEMTFEVMT